MLKLPSILFFPFRESLALVRRLIQVILDSRFLFRFGASAAEEDSEFDTDEDAIFGVDLSVSFNRARKGGYAPLIIRLTEYLCERGVEDDGIFRVCGSLVHIQAARCLLDQDVVKVELDDFDIHEVASLFKQYLLQLPSPLIPTETYGLLFRIVQRRSTLWFGIINRSPVCITEPLETDKEIEEVRKILDTLPLPNWVVLGRVVELLWKINQRSVTNTMTVSNLAFLFAPILLHENRLEYIRSATLVMVVIIQGYETLFLRARTEE